MNLHSISLSLSSPATFSTFPACHAVGTSSAGGPTGPSKGWAGFPCPPPHRSARGNRRLYPAAGTSSRVWSLGICRPRPWRAPTAAGPRGGCGAHLVCRPKWCWRWTSTTRPPCLLLERGLEQLVEEKRKGRVKSPTWPSDSHPKLQTGILAPLVPLGILYVPLVLGKYSTSWSSHYSKTPTGGKQKFNWTKSPIVWQSLIQKSPLL